MATGQIDATGVLNKTYSVRPVGPSVQELWLCGGLEGYILKEIQAQV